MRRLSAIFIAVCMVLIAASLGAILYFGFRVDPRVAGIAGVGALTAMGLYNTITHRLRDRADLGDQIGDLSRGTADLARQVAELSRRLNAVETNVGNSVERARGAIDPLAGEIGELGSLVRQIAETVAAHDIALTRGVMPLRVLSNDEPMPSPQSFPMPDVPEGDEQPLALSDADAVSPPRRFPGLTQDSIVDMVLRAADESRIDLYLQPIVTLPQRKVRYYEAVSRLRTPEGDIVPAADFIEIAEASGLMPRIDNMLVFRCVQVVRRLQLKSRDVGVFCNISGTTLTDGAAFRQLLEFADANRALSQALMFEFTQGAYRNFGPIEYESMAALAERGFRFSMDHVSDLRMEPKDLHERGFRFLKVPAKLLLHKNTASQSDIAPEDIADLLARSGVDLIAERIENEAMVVDLLDYDVRFGQGFLFSAPRPVRAEALGSGAAAGELAAAG